MRKWKNGKDPSFLTQSKLLGGKDLTGVFGCERIQCLLEIMKRLLGDNRIAWMNSSHPMSFRTTHPQMEGHMAPWWAYFFPGTYPGYLWARRSSSRSSLCQLCSCKSWTTSKPSGGRGSKSSRGPEGIGWKSQGASRRGQRSVVNSTRWWFHFFFHPYLGKIPILTNIFQMGWNHQLGIVWLFLYTFCTSLSSKH